MLFTKHIKLIGAEYSGRGIQPLLKLAIEPIIAELARQGILLGLHLHCALRTNPAAEQAERYAAVHHIHRPYPIEGRPVRG